MPNLLWIPSRVDSLPGNEATGTPNALPLVQTLATDPTGRVGWRLGLPHGPMRVVSASDGDPGPQPLPGRRTFILFPRYRALTSSSKSPVSTARTALHVRAVFFSTSFSMGEGLPANPRPTKHAPTVLGLGRRPRWASLRTTKLRNLRNDLHKVGAGAHASHENFAERDSNLTTLVRGMGPAERGTWLRSSNRRARWRN